LSFSSIRNEWPCWTPTCTPFRRLRDLPVVLVSLKRIQHGSEFLLVFSFPHRCSLRSFLAVKCDCGTCPSSRLQQRAAGLWTAYLDSDLPCPYWQQRRDPRAPSVFLNNYGSLSPLPRSHGPSSHLLPRPSLTELPRRSVLPSRIKLKDELGEIKTQLHVFLLHLVACCYPACWCHAN
jgi:hypothetical protein